MRFKYLNTILFVALFFKLSSQTYNFTLYNDKNGLNQPYIYSVSQTPEGFLAMSTGEALCLFDGNMFSAISNKKMIEDIISIHFIDSKNITWLGHQQNGISYIKDGQYHKFNNKLFSDIKVTQIIEDNKECKWVATNGGLFTIDSNFNVLKINVPQIKSFNSICFDYSGNLIAGTDDGVMILTLDNNNLVKKITEIAELKNKTIKQIVKSTKLNYWVLVDGEGIYGLTFKDGTYARSTHIYEELKPLNFNINCIYSDRFQNLWVSVFGDGLRKISFKGLSNPGNYSVIKLDKSNGLKSQNIQSIFQDSEGNMWFGTFGDGLIKRPVEMFSFYGKNEGVNVTDVKKIVTDLEGNIWMGTDKGLTVFNKPNNTYLLYNADNGFITDEVKALIMDEKGILWIGTSQNGIYTFNPKTKKFINFSKTKKLNHLSINTVIQTQNSLIFGSTDGLYIYNKTDGSSEVLTTSDGLLHNNVLYVFEDSKKRLWIASHGAVPYYIFSQKITAFKKIKNLNSFNINSICEDKHGNIWIATEGDGVFKYDNKTFYHYTTANGLISNYCMGVKIDRNNSVWVSHADGLSELKVQHIKFTAFSNQRGLLFYENNLNAIHTDIDTNLWFGTSQGVVRYDPETGRIGNKIPEIFITKIIMNNKIYNPKDIIIKKYRDYTVHIDFRAISLSEPEAIYYKYRLTDVDSAWRITKTPFVDFPKLGDGEYVFEVIACNANNGLCANIPATAAFKINEPVWKSVWFYFALLLLIIIVLYIIIYLRVKTLKKTQAFLKIKIEQKTYLLQREKEAVERVKLELEHKNKSMTESIQYAKHIQDSLLPPEELLTDLFKENYFVLYKPKDIVSGDFYWCTGHEMDNLISLNIAAVIDCTGHGVPGAFLSILANGFLKQSVFEKNINTPDEILNFLNENISSHLNQTSSKNTVHDGMDIALVGIDYSNMQLYYAGANNPVCIYRPGINGVEEIILKPTKQAIGSSTGKKINYKLNVIQIFKGDTIYLFSDGYADQFGGSRNKKITTKNFRTILSKAFLLPISKQKDFIENRLEVWKNETEQTDDVCVMGIKI